MIFFLEDTFSVVIQISLKFVRKCLVDNESAFVQVMARHRTGDKQLPEAMLITDTYMHRQVSKR